MEAVGGGGGSELEIKNMTSSQMSHLLHSTNVTRDWIYHSFIQQSINDLINLFFFLFLKASAGVFPSA